MVASGARFFEVIRRVLGVGRDLVITSGQGAATARYCSATLCSPCGCPCRVGALDTRHPARGIMAAVTPVSADPLRDGLGHTIKQLASTRARQDDARQDETWLDGV